MKSFQILAILSTFYVTTLAQAPLGIYDIWQTTWDGSKSFTYINSGAPVSWVTPAGPIGSADIVISDTTLYQQIDGFGASLTDSAALVLNNLKSANSANYWSLLGYTFDPRDGVNSAGLSYIRIPLGSSDLSARAYSYCDSCDSSLSGFSIDVAPSYVYSVLNDIKSINGQLKLHFVPWSMPAFMKTSGTLLGGSFSSNYINAFANYLFKSVQAWAAKGFTAYAVGIQNEPQNSNPTYPTALVTASQEAQVAIALRTLLDNNGFSAVKIIGYEHNWDVTSYPETVVSSAYNQVAGTAWHCYAGGVGSQSTVHNAYPGKDTWFTECAGTIGSDKWSDIKWQTSNLWIGAINNWARSALMWSLVANADGSPVLPGTSSCGGGCRGVISVSGTSWSVNQEFLGLAQANKAVLPKDAGGPYGQRIGVSVGGSLSWALVVSAFKTTRLNSADWNRYSIVVLNWDDSSSTAWNPVSVRTTIEFRGYQATYTFPVGITTLWWFAAN